MLTKPGTQREHNLNKFKTDEDHRQCFRHKNGPTPTFVIVHKNHSQVSCVFMFTEVNLIESDKIVHKLALFLFKSVLQIY